MKKGFTLIELLASIVILAVIALVSIPVVTNVISSGKESAVEKSATFYIKELESRFSEWTVEGIPSELEVDESQSGYAIFKVEQLNKILEFEGTIPASGSVMINNNYSLNNQFYGYVISAELEFDNGYVATYTYDTLSLNQGSRSSIEVTKK